MNPSNSNGGEAQDEFSRREHLELLIPNEALGVIRQEVPAPQNRQRETGGIIIGGRANVNRLFVTAFTGPGPNAAHHEELFSPDIEYAQQQLDAYREDWDVKWLGVWHKHPGQMRSLSPGDIQQMRELVKDPDTLNEVVSIIATQDGNTVRLNGYHMDESLEPYRLSMTIVDDDAPIRKQFLREPDPEPPGENESPQESADAAPEDEKEHTDSTNAAQTREGRDEDFGDAAGEDPPNLTEPLYSDTGFGPDAAASNCLDLAAASQSALLHAGLPATGNTTNPDYESPSYDPERDDIVVSMVEQGGKDGETHFPPDQADDRQREVRDGDDEPHLKRSIIRSVQSILTPDRWR